MSGIPDIGRNASENPAGIETIFGGGGYTAIAGVATHQKTQQGLKLGLPILANYEYRSRNASENPAGIETHLTGLIRLTKGWSQRIRKPSRD